jgi:hypothetical protein
MVRRIDVLQLRCLSDLRVASVHQQLDPAHERAVAGREIERGRRDVVSLAVPSQRRVEGCLLEVRGVFLL